MSAVFERGKVRRWRRDMWRELVRAGFSPQRDTRKMSAALVLFAVSAIGTEITALMELTGLQAPFIRATLKRLRQQRILTGQKLRTAWDSEAGGVAVMLDAMTAAGELYRPPDPKRSAAQRRRAPESRARGPRAKRPPVTLAPGVVFTPPAVKSNPYYGLSEWEGKGDR